MIEEAKLIELIKAKLPQLLRDDEEFRALVFGTLIQYLPTREEIRLILERMEERDERMDRFEKQVMAELRALREDFNRMQQTIAEMQQTQKEHLERTANLETAVDRLQQAHDRLESKHDRLESKHDRLESKHDRLESKHDRLESKHDRLEYKVDAGFSRFGILFEDTLRKTLKSAVENWLQAAQVESMELGGRQVDIVIRDSEHILLEVTARPHSHDIDKMKKSAADYEEQFGIKPRLAIACAYLTPDMVLRMLEEEIEVISGNPPE